MAHDSTIHLTQGNNTRLHRTLWRWHFYAGLFVIPWVIVLSLTGAAYLFKPQVDRWEERAFTGPSLSAPANPDRQRAAALGAFPGARFVSYRLPEQNGDAALVHLALSNGTMRDVFVSPGGTVVGSLDPTRRIMQVVHDLHGKLLAGRVGSWLVELAGSWALVLVITGLYLWWPRTGGLAGIVWPRLASGKRVLWRDLHAVTGFWVSGLALVLLLTALPWTSVWGSAFKAVRTELAGRPVRQDWTIGGRAPASNDHAEHDHAAMAGMTRMAPPAEQHDLLNAVVARAKSEHLAFPVLITPPAQPGEPWQAKSDTQNRPLRTTVTYDGQSGQLLTRETFMDKPLVDQIVGYGVAWHEGQLFGWINQLIGLLTAALLVLVAATGFVQWRRRKPADTLGAPPAARAGSARTSSVRASWAILLIAAALLPLLALSLIGIVLLEGIVRATLPRLAHWLGLARPASA